MLLLWLTLHVKWVRSSPLCCAGSVSSLPPAARIGTLLRISGQVVRTHPVHPELVSGTFLCLDCQSVIKDVEQQFKYTQPTICKNPVCANRRRFMLDTNKSRFVDFQKVRMWGFLTISATKLSESDSPKKLILDFVNYLLPLPKNKSLCRQLFVAISFKWNFVLKAKFS